MSEERLARILEEQRRQKFTEEMASIALMWTGVFGFSSVMCLLFGWLGWQEWLGWPGWRGSLPWLFGFTGLGVLSLALMELYGRSLQRGREKRGACATARATMTMDVNERIKRSCCVDCGLDWLISDHCYMVHDYVWAATGLAYDGGVLCLADLRRRLGRPLRLDDFPMDVPRNHECRAAIRRAVIQDK